MRHVYLLVLAFGFAASALAGEDQRPEFHGFATQAFVFSGANNYLGMNTSSGSAAWSEAAINVNDQVTDKLRVGLQFHFTRLGQFGDSAVSLDWALGDYKINRWVGLRAGKVKIRWGLYNDIQDADPGYLWALLPEPIYAVDLRATNLSQTGAELYGGVPLGRKRGELAYSLYYGDYSYASNDGYMEGFKQAGLSFANQPGGKTPGFDLRWKTPFRGLTVGGSLMMYDAKGNLTNGTFRQPLTYWPTYYTQYENRKFRLAWQYMKLVQYTTTMVDSDPPSTGLSDTRAWFAMGEYRVTDKLQVGFYHTRYKVASAEDHSDPANRFNDSVVSARYDFNSYFYWKLEGHFIDGNGLGFYAFDNPDGLKPRSRLLVAKVGFTF
ncbi:MAG: hypothetical protein WDO73_35600 [Ignavibacteriota bacterium]